LRSVTRNSGGIPGTPYGIARSVRCVLRSHSAREGSSGRRWRDGRQRESSMSPFSEKATATSGKSTARPPFGFAQGRLRLAALAQGDRRAGGGHWRASRQWHPAGGSGPLAEKDVGSVDPTYHSRPWPGAARRPLGGRSRLGARGFRSFPLRTHQRLLGWRRGVCPAATQGRP
jgi:hypothetical protein